MRRALVVAMLAFAGCTQILGLDDAVVVEKVTPATPSVSVSASVNEAGTEDVGSD